MNLSMKLAVDIKSLNNLNRRPRIRISEDHLQISQMEWCGYNIKPHVLYYSTPNERQSSPKNMQKLKRMGLLPGVGDLTFIITNKVGMRVHYIENKRPTTYKPGAGGDLIIDQRGGEITDDQIAFRDKAIRAGATYDLIDNLKHFIALMEKYRLARGF